MIEVTAKDLAQEHKKLSNPANYDNQTIVVANNIKEIFHRKPYGGIYSTSKRKEETKREETKE